MKKLFALLLTLWTICAVIVPSAAQAQTLYGIIALSPNNGYLIKINTLNGDATLIGEGTGLLNPGGLAYSQDIGLYAIDIFGGQVYSVNSISGTATPLSSPGSVIQPEALAHRYVDNILYTVPTDPIPDLYQLDPTTGANIGSVGSLGAGLINGLAVQPSNGVLFGAGTTTGLDDRLFTISLTPYPTGILRWPVGPTGRYISALAFHPDGTLYATDGDNLLTINPDDGAVTEIGPFGTDIGFVTGLAVAMSPTLGDIDIWIKDCAADNGTVPSTPLCPKWYKSPDIWIDNDADMIIDAPVVGEDNILKALVRNSQTGTAQDVSVKFYYRDNTTGLVFPDGANYIGEDNVTIPSNGIALASVTWENLPAPPTTGGHWCIGVVLEHAEDPRISPTVIPPNDNNVGIANIWFIAGRAGEQVVMDFSVGTGGKSGFGLQPWPREFILQVNDQLPTGWSRTLEGIEADQPFTLRLGEERAVQLNIQVAGDAAPHTGGFIEVRQVDVATGRLVGGVEFNLYEDHRPPEAVRTLQAAILDGSVVLTWDPVLKESETGLRECVAYYEVLRDRNAVAKVLRDEDPYKPGMQWTDMDPVNGKVSYAIRVIDEGENISEISPEITVTIPGETALFNWLTWLLLLLAIILLIVLLIRKEQKIERP